MKKTWSGKRSFPSRHLAQLGLTTFDFVARQQGLIANDSDDGMQKVILPGTLIPQPQQLATDSDNPPAVASVHRDRKGVHSRPVRASTRQRRKMLDQFPLRKRLQQGCGRAEEHTASWMLFLEAVRNNIPVACSCCPGRHRYHPSAPFRACGPFAEDFPSPNCP